MNRDELSALLGTVHGLVPQTLEGVTDEQFVAIPDGFNNNILWNVGHITHVMSSLCYRPAGLDAIVPDFYNEAYKNGSSPADWSETPSIEEAKSTLAAAGGRVQEDLKSGAMDNFNAFELFPGFKIESADQALAFNAFHLGIHIGMIMNLKKIVG
ncbi:MAG TPA: DinB family protein [Candidatus Hydrogenedentes bacterium]|nr:DinB family protein [Candidatus Hydrogenedentota bacterium]